MENNKRNAQNMYRKVTHKEHILMRPERHIGPVKPRTENTWFVDLKGEIQFGDITYRPAFLKMFDEIITNSVDFSRTPEGSHLNKIRVDICQMSGAIAIYDNGGIPVIKHEEYQGWLPDMLFGELFSSSNYNEEDEELANVDGAGQNGEGASLVNVFSSLFRVETCDGTNKFDRTWKANSTEWLQEKITKSSIKGTTITYIPDLSRFPEGNYDHDILMLKRRVYEIAVCNPHINVIMNGKEVTGDFSTFCGKLGSNLVSETPKWKIGLFQSSSFRHMSYVNSVNTRVGGPHVEYVLDKIISHARPKLKRATKVDYKPSYIKNVLGLVLICDIRLPRFNGQIKEELTTTLSEFGSRWEPDTKFLDNAAKAIVGWFETVHKSLMSEEEDKLLDKTQKEIEGIKFYQIPKYMRATSKNREECTLFLTEGDSAAKPIGAAADRKIHGIYPLRGKIINALNASKKDFGANEEIKAIVSIMNGLKLRGGIEESKLRYSSVVIATDADVDGIHIRGLIALAFLKYWPDFIKQGRLKYLRTPVVVAYDKKGVRSEFFEEHEFEAHPEKEKFSRVKYLKGLGSNDTASFRKYLEDPKYTLTFSIDDLTEEKMKSAFCKEEAEARKQMFENIEYDL